MHERKRELQLQMYVRHVHTSDGKVHGEMRVFCPDQRQQVSAEECADCPRWCGIDRTPADGRTFLRCQPRTDGAVGYGATPCDAVCRAMTSSVVCVEPELSIQAVLDIFLERNISGAAVVDRRGKLVGVVSKTDLLAAKNLAVDIDRPERLPQTVDDAMTPMVFALHEHASMSQAAGLMAVEGIHRLMIVSPGGELVGVLSSLDVLRWLAMRDGYLTLSSNEQQRDTKTTETPS